MRLTIFALVLLSAVFVLAAGAAQLTADDRGYSPSNDRMAMCNLKFDNEMDLGHKGYLTERDLESSYYGGTSPRTYAYAASKFDVMDLDDNGRVTPYEYCNFQ